MTPELSKLLEQIESFELNRPESEYPFTARLAYENAWTQTYTDRVVKEYKRFVFLALVSEHTVTPSQDVDQVWHLHLIYTRSYWDEFCAGVLRRPLHHQPTAGGQIETDKYRVLAGANPFAQIEVTREQIQRRTEQELHNLLLRLRHRYVAVASDSGMLARALVGAARPFALEIKALLQLAGKEVPVEDRTAAVFETGADAFGLEREPLTRLAQLRKDARPPGDLADLFRGVLGAVARAVDIAGQMRESPR